MCQNKYTRQFLLLLAGLTFLLSGFTFLIAVGGGDSYISWAVWSNIPFMALLTLVIYMLTKRGVAASSHRSFMYHFMGGILLKMILALAFLIIVLLSGVNKNYISFITFFSASYVFYTVLEVYYLLKLIPSTSSQAKSNEG